MMLAGDKGVAGEISCDDARAGDDFTVEGAGGPVSLRIFLNSGV